MCHCQISIIANDKDSLLKCISLEIWIAAKIWASAFIWLWTLGPKNQHGISEGLPFSVTGHKSECCSSGGYRAILVPDDYQVSVRPQLGVVYLAWDCSVQSALIEWKHYIISRWYAANQKRVAQAYIKEKIFNKIITVKNEIIIPSSIYGWKS